VKATNHDKLGRAALALAQIFAEKTGGQLSFRLWTGDVVSSPSVDGKPPFQVGIRSAAAMRQMMLKPGIESAAQLYALGEFEYGDVHPKELINRVDHTRLVRAFGWADRMRLMRAALPILIGGGKLEDTLAFEGQ
jgi:hypothetical protein